VTALAAVLAAAGLALLAAAVMNRARSTALPRSLVVEYLPRRGSTVVADAILAGRERRAATAALLDLAVRRRVRLIVDRTGARRAAVAVELVDDAPLGTRDIALLGAVSDSGRGGRLRRFSRDRRRTARRVRSLVDGTAAALARRGLLAAGTPVVRPVLRRFAVLVILIAAGATLLGLTLGDLVTAALAGASLLAAAGALAVVPRGSERRFTARAEPLRRHLDGLRQYLVIAEKDRLRALQSLQTADIEATPPQVRAELGTAAGRLRLHERLLPYAVIFGVEQQWLAELRIANDDLDRDALASLDDAAGVAADLFVVAEALGGLSDLVASLDGVADAAGAAFDAADALGALGDLLP
jgi:hypothetical protein